MKERTCPEGINCVGGAEVGWSLVNLLPAVSCFMHCSIFTERLPWVGLVLGWVHQGSVWTDMLPWQSLQLVRETEQTLSRGCKFH